MLPGGCFLKVIIFTDVIRKWQFSYLIQWDEPVEVYVRLVKECMIFKVNG